jgi:hypothetical protein
MANCPLVTMAWRMLRLRPPDLEESCEYSDLAVRTAERDLQLRYTISDIVWFLRTRKWISGFHKIQEYYWIDDQLWAAQKWISCVELIS